MYGIGVLSCYIALVPIVVTGLVNACFCKSSVLDSLRVPIDGGRVMKDGRRMFGENKTWKGFLATIVFCAVLSIIWGIICRKNTFLMEHNLLYYKHENACFYNVFMGALIGFAYAFMELPNSYIKRRLDIHSGSRGSGILGIFFAIYDQVDSLIWVILVVATVYPMGIKLYLLCVLVAGIIHLGLNIILYCLRLRKNIL